MHDGSHPDPAAQTDEGAHDPLPEPAVADLRLETILGALADPLRLTVVRKLMRESDAYDHPCGWFGFDRPKSSLTHHFKALRLRCFLTKQFSPHCGENCAGLI